MGWKIVERPGYLGRTRNDKYREWTEQYGPGKWRLAWKVHRIDVDFLGACQLYQAAYEAFFNEKKNYQILYDLVHEASDVWDSAESNVSSRFDYMKQETPATHIQDIAIRCALLRSGSWFKGDRLIRIRDIAGDHPLSLALSPGRVPFHLPNLIVKPELVDDRTWYRPGSVESFYQSNKHLYILE